MRINVAVRLVLPPNLGDYTLPLPIDLNFSEVQSATALLFLGEILAIQQETPDMADLTSKQRAHLRSLAHHLKPIIQVGTDGVSEAVLKTVKEAFNTRELLKVKVLEAAPESARETGDAIVAALDEVQVAQTIGRTVVLYRPHEENPEIQLPG